MRITAKRFVTARRIANLRQSDATRLLGFANSGTLSKVESGINTPSLLVLVRCSMLYAVSADYLLGLSNYPERDQATIEQIAVQRSIRNDMTKHVAQITATVISNAKVDAATSGHLASVCKAVNKAYGCYANKSTHPNVTADAMNEMADTADAAYIYMRRKQAIKAGDVIPLEEIEENGQYPLALFAENGGLGALEADDELQAELDANPERAEKFVNNAKQMDLIHG